MAYKIKNINYNSISNADEYVVYTVEFDVEDTNSGEQVSFTQDFYFYNGTKQDEVTASVISLLSGAVSIMYNKATYYNLSINSDEIANVISTVFTSPDLTSTSTVTEVPVVQESTSTPIDSFGVPTSTEEVTATVESVVEEPVVEEATPIVETTNEPTAEVTTTSSTETISEEAVVDNTTSTTVTDTTTDTSSTDTTTDSGTTDTTSTDTTENNG